MTTEAIHHQDPETDDLVMRLFLTPEGRGAPFGILKEIRDRAPVYKTAFGPWLLTRYDDCRTALREPRMGKDWAGLMESSGIDDWREHSSTSFGERSMLFANPPQHTRLRRLVAKAFTPRTVDRLRPSMRILIDQLLDKIEHDGGGELLDAFAFPFPVAVIGELLGVPAADRPRFREHVRVNTATLELGVTKEQIALADISNDWLRSYFADLIVEKRRTGGDDMLCRMIEVEEDGQHLSDTEIIDMGLLLFAAGFETTTNLIGNGIYCLLRFPDQAARLRANPDLMPSAIEEILRYETSIQISGRTAFEDIEIGGAIIKAGETALTALGAANRDPAKFSEPERFDIGRVDNEPLSFGSGIHFCLGASLARAEGIEAFTALIARFATIELTVEPTWRDQFGFHGLQRLDVRAGN
ncbi:MAG: cytochrome P450 [Hyphomicrobiaceae bacterium]|jgi:cytochrome P450